MTTATSVVWPSGWAAPAACQSTGPPATTTPDAGSTIEPSALTAAIAPIVKGSTRADAVPSPPGAGWPEAAPTLAPVPAPTRPQGSGASEAATAAASPSAGPGLVVAVCRSNRIAVGTMGTIPNGVS